MANPDAEKQREDFERFGQEIPDSLWPPEFVPGASAWYAAFWELSSDRQIGMGEGPIQYSSIRLYTSGWPADEVAMFTRCIRAMDGVYLDHANRDGKPQEFSREMFRGAMSGK